MNKKEFKETLKKLEKYKFLLIVVLTGILLLSFPKKNGNITPSATADPPAFSLADTERKIEKTLAAIEGTGRVQVALTLKSDMETIFLQDSTQKTAGDTTEDRRETVKGGDSNPVVRKQNYPVYQGILVVCDGGGNPKVALAVKEAVGGLTGLSGKSVTVAKMESN